jgi:hypothetical protein
MIGLAFRHENRLPLPGLAVGPRGVFEEGAVETQGLPWRQRRDQPRLNAPENGGAGEEEKLRERHELTAYSSQLTAVSRQEFSVFSYQFSVLRLRKAERWIKLKTEN